MVEYNVKICLVKKEIYSQMVSANAFFKPVSISADVGKCDILKVIIGNVVCV